MSRVKSPLLSLGATGCLGDSLTFTRRRHVNILEKKPIPTDVRSLAQMYQRWLYQDYTAWWHTLSMADKQVWNSLASSYHMTGYAYWMSDRLHNLPDIVLGLRLDNISGTTTPDFSKHSHTPTVFGAFTTDGIIGPAFSFDGLDDFIRIPYHSSMDLTTELSMEAFVQLVDGQNQKIAQRDGFAGNTRSWIFYKKANNRLYFVWYADGSLPSVHSPWIPLDSTMHYVAVTFDHGTVIMRVDDTAWVWPYDDPSIYVPTHPLTVGHGPVWGPSPADGIIDNYVLYNRVLPQVTLSNHAQRRYPL